MERFDTAVRYHAWYEHWHRYHFVKEIVKDKVICDVACGEGYGSALLASIAKNVIGVDIDSKTVEEASSKYSHINNLSFIKSNALTLEFNDDSFDVVISFETLEHLSEHNELLAEFKRILKVDGLLVISTPDKDVYSVSDDHNKFHVKELNAHEFDSLIHSFFEYQNSYGQQFQLMSVIENLYANDTTNNEKIYVEQGSENQQFKNLTKPEYLIKICSNSKQSLDDLLVPNSHSFMDSMNSLFVHYDAQIMRLLQIDSQNKKLVETVEKQNAIINHLKARLGY